MGKQAVQVKQPPPKQRAKPKAKPEVEEKSKEEVDEERRLYVQDNERQKAEFYEEEAAKKLRECKGIEISVTYIEDKDSRKPKAIDDLSAFWREDLGIMPFMPFDNVGMCDELPPNMDPADRIAFLELFREQLQQLLRMKFHIFWSQVIFDEEVQKALDSYLRHCLRAHDVARSGKGQNGESTLVMEEGTLAADISRSILAIFSRLSRPQETPHDFISSQKYGDLILKHRIFDIPKLIDICTIYGDSNRPTVTKIVHSVFAHQPIFKVEFEKAVVGHILGGLHQCCLPLQQSGFAARPHGVELGIDECLTFLPDVLSCFNAVFCFFPEDLIRLLVGSSLTMGSSKLPLDELMVLLHDSVLALERRGGKTRLNDIKSLFHTIRMLLCRLLSCILGFQMAPRRGPSAFDDLLEWCKKREDDHGELLQDLGKHGLDNVAIEWHASGQVDDALMDYLETLCGTMLPPEARTARQRHARAAAAKASATSPGAGSSSSAAAPKASTSSASDAAKIREVRDIVGTSFGEGFILQCLLHYGFSVHSVVNAILDGSLPPQLETLPKDLKLGQAPPENKLGPRDGGKLSADDKRRIADQTSRMERDEIERRKQEEEAAQAMKAVSSMLPSPKPKAKGKKKPAFDYDEYDDDADDAPQGGGGVKVAAGGNVDSSDGDSESGEDSGEDGSRQWGPDRGRGGRIKGGGKGKHKDKGPVQGQTFEAKRKEANKAKVGNHNRRDGAAWKQSRASGGQSWS